MSNWKFDEKVTQDRCRKLKRYYETHGLNADNFACKHYAICSKFHPSGVSKQYAGGTAGLTPFYDVEYKRKSIRVLVVGTESGYTPSEKYGTTANFEDRCRALLQRINAEKNPHILGTLITLQRVFQVKTDYIYASYALSNALRCAFQNNRKHSSRTGVHVNSHMRKNCFKYLVEEIKILEPNLLITQGGWSIQPFVQRLAKELGSACKTIRPLKISPGREYGLYELFPDFMCITTQHPSYFPQWEKNYAPYSLWPAIEQLREMHYLPTFEQNAFVEYEKLVKPRVDKMLELGSRIC